MNIYSEESLFKGTDNWPHHIKLGYLKQLAKADKNIKEHIKFRADYGDWTIPCGEVFTREELKGIL